MRHVSWRVVTLGVMATLAGPLLAIPSASAADGVTINLVVTNDFHGQIDDNLVQWAATVDDLLDDAPEENSLFLAAGDNVGMSVPASEEADDNPTIDALNMLGLDASAVGNHEFDKGYDDLTQHIMQRAEFPILGANVKKADGSAALEPSAMFTVAGIRVAVIGAVTPETPDLVVHSDGIAGLSFTDPVAAINETVADLNALPEGERPDVMVAVVHWGSAYNQWTPGQEQQEDAAFARLLTETSPDVDAIVTGHTHKHYAVQAPVPGEPERTRPVIQSGDHGEYVGQVTLSVDPATGAVLSNQAQVVARSTESDATLIADRPFLAQFADLRDQAVTYANNRIAEREATQTKYDAAVATAETDRAAAEARAAEYHEAKVARNNAYGAWLEIKNKIDTFMAASRKSYAEAADLKSRYDALIADGRKAYGEAAAYRDEYQSALAEGRQAYGEAADLKAQYEQLMTESRDAKAEADEIKAEYDSLLAESRQAYADAADLKAQYDSLYDEAARAYGEVTAIRDEYMSVQAAGGPDSAAQLATLQDAYYTKLGEANTLAAQAAAVRDDYLATIAKAEAAFAKISPLQAPYDDAIARSRSAYDRAAALKEPFDAAMATAGAAFTRLEELKDPYNAAIATAQKAYGDAAALQDPYYAAIAAAEAALNSARQLMPSYQTALDVVNEAEKTLAAVKKLLDEAIAVLNAALKTVDDLKVTLLGLL